MSRYTIENGYHKKAGVLRHLIPVIALVSIIGSGYALYDKTPRSAVEAETPVYALAQPKEELRITSPMPWPQYGQSAYGVTDNGILASSAPQSTSVPVASLAKVITALAVLKQKPLAPGEQGPMITLNEQDVALYNDYLRKDGSVTPVEVGERITQYQAMLAMMLPSSNNMSDSLTRWAFGSDEAYIAYANKMIKDLGLKNTLVADASGFSPNTKSTAEDMVQLGILYMKNPLLKQIAMQREATIPVAGVIPNYNAPLNKDGILGIKVGYTDEAGRSFLVADVRKDGTVSVAAAVGAPDLATAMRDAIGVLNAGNTGYDTVQSRR